MKKISVMMLAMLTMFLICSSCSSDDEEDGNSPGNTPSKAESSFLGVWKVSKIADAVSRSGILGFFAGGELFIENYNKTDYSWAYNSSTGILATDVRYGLYNESSYQWQVNMIAENSWTGLLLANGTQTVTASRCTPYQSACLVIGHKKWLTKNKVKELPLDAYRDYIYWDNSHRLSSEAVTEDRARDILKVGAYTIYHPYDNSAAYIESEDGIKYYPE